VTEFETVSTAIKSRWMPSSEFSRLRYRVGTDGSFMPLVRQRVTCRELGFEMSARPSDPSVMRVVKQLQVPA
jgi:hypothetical protein